MSKLLTRRAVLAGGLATAGAIGLAACGSSSSKGSHGDGEVEQIKYQLSWLTTTEFCGTYLAMERGYFEQVGQEVTLLPGGPNVQPETLVAAGRAPIGTYEPDTIGAAIAHGADLKIFAVRYRRSPFCILSSKKKPVRTPKDLEGKTIGVPPSNNVQLRMLGALNDVSIDRLHTVPISFDVTPLMNGQVDAMTGFITDEAISLRLAKFPVEVMMFSDFHYAIFGGCYFATSDTIKSRPDSLVKFLTAEQRGWELDIKQPRAGTDITEKRYGDKIKLGHEQQQLSNEALISLMGKGKGRGLFDLTDAEMRSNVETLADGKIDVGVDQLFTTDIVDRLYG